MKTILIVVGARPNFMKAAPLVRALRAHGGFRVVLVHTGQHYDARMSDVFFEQLGLPAPDVHLGVGSGGHAEQTARIMTTFDPVLDTYAPDVVVVVGDVNSTLACALVAAKRHVPVAHVEAGLRSFDRSMPEEINRIVTDHLSDLLFVTEPSGVENLRREGVAASAVHHVGNVMIDTLRAGLPAARATGIVARHGLAPGAYALVTMHRPANVDEAEPLGEVVRLVMQVAEMLPVVWPLHPRTRARLEALGHLPALERHAAIHLLAPLPYLEFVGLMEQAAVVVTDSGGLQEETTALGVPCLTVRESTERPVTITEGTNELMPLRAAEVAARVAALRRGEGKAGRVPALWDGHAAERIVAVLARFLGLPPTA